MMKNPSQQYSLGALFLALLALLAGIAMTMRSLSIVVRHREPPVYAIADIGASTDAAPANPLHARLHDSSGQTLVFFR